jgi:hypothetical protein
LVGYGPWIASQSASLIEKAAAEDRIREPMTLKIEKSTRRIFTVFTLIGRMEAEHVAELQELFDDDYRLIVLDLEEVRLADRNAVRFLKACEAYGMSLENCPGYVREWIDREKD